MARCWAKPGTSIFPTWLTYGTAPMSAWTMMPCPTKSGCCATGSNSTSAAARVEPSASAPLAFHALRHPAQGLDAGFGNGRAEAAVTGPGDRHPGRFRPGAVQCLGDMRRADRVGHALHDGGR